ncbi:MAG: PAS domain S-box protein [Deltaproteobacteria bacterium]|nr:PAS domain S-box protein [Deltaproteobacteria bacterium]
MKIRTRLQISVTLSFVLAVTVGTLAFTSARSVKKAEVETEKITEIISGISALQNIAHEYSHYFGERSLIQSQLVYDSLLELLSEWRFSDHEKRITADHIIRDLKSFKADFSRLVAIVKKIKASGRQGNAISQELKERLTVQLMVKLQAATSLALQLQGEIQSDLSSTLYRNSVAIACYLSLLTGLMVGILFWVRSSLAKPITNLQEGIRRIGAGHLDHQVGTDATDEIGELSRAFDLMTKDLKRSTASIVDLNREIAERKKVEQALRESEWKYRKILETTSEGCWMLDPQLKTIEVNDSLCKMLGYSRGEMLGKTPFEFVDEENRKIFVEQTSKIPGTSHRSYEIKLKKKNGEDLSVWFNATTIKDEQGNVQSAFAFVTDITERKRLEAQLLQAQKMVSVGRLAGGVAHDFNNMLGVIIGHTELAIDQVDPSLPLHADLKEILKAAQRSADLTRQLLAFARRQTAAPRVLDLNDTIGGMLKMLRRLIGEDIELAWMPGAGIWPVKIDPGQVDQILANLCVNARDAIAGVGKITIETHNIVLDETYCTDHPGFVPGEYVMLTVSDNGCGMNKETLANIFEPFFTTKEVGEGTGMGLSTVYGIVKQNDGFINVYSEPGQGAAFKIYIPRTKRAEKVTEKYVEPAIPKGTETVLLVEDEAPVLALGKTVLERFGYTVLAALTPLEALAMAKEHKGPIHLLITDIVMPEMNGKELKTRIEKLKPDIEVLYMSGYPADVIVHRGILEDNVHFLEKPFSINSLLGKVREVLDQT